MAQLKKGSAVPTAYQGAPGDSKQLRGNVTSTQAQAMNNAAQQAMGQNNEPLKRLSK